VSEGERGGGGSRTASEFILEDICLGDAAARLALLELREDRERTGSGRDSRAGGEGSGGGEGLSRGRCGGAAG
jgi:hypothetical protein